MDNTIWFEKKLKEFYNKNLLLTNNDEIEISDDKINSITNNILKISRLKILKQTKSQISLNYVKGITFGKLLETLRTKSNLTHKSIADLLNSKIDLIKDLENNRINPSSISATIISSILNTFNITLIEFVETLKNYFLILNRNDKEAMARYSGSSKDKAKNIKSALDSALVEINRQENNNKNLSIDNEYINLLKKELINLKRLDLI